MSSNTRTRRKSAPSAYNYDSLPGSRQALNLPRPASPQRRQNAKPSTPALDASIVEAGSAAAADDPYDTASPSEAKQGKHDVESHQSATLSDGDKAESYLGSGSDNSLVWSEAVDKTASAIAYKVCPELYALIQDSLADQASHLIKLLQPLCSELGLVAHRLTVAVERAEPLKSEPSSSESSDGDCRSPRPMSPKSRKQRPMSPDFSTTSTTQGEVDQRTREPRVASAPELPLPAKKSITQAPIARPPQSVTLSALPDIKFDSGGKKSKSGASQAGSHKNQKQDSFSPTSSRLSSKDTRLSSKDRSKRGGKPGKLEMGKGASLIGVCRGKQRASHMRHLSHTTDLRFLTDSLASELFKATDLVPGTPGLPSKHKPWTSAVPTNSSASKEIPKGMKGLSSLGMQNGTAKVSPLSPSSNTTVSMIHGSSNQSSYNSNGRRTGSKDSNKEMAAPMLRPMSPTDEVSPPSSLSPSSLSEVGLGEQPEEPVRNERPSHSAPVHSTLLTLPPLTGDGDQEVEINGSMSASAQEEFQPLRRWTSESQDCSGSLRHPRRRSLTQPPSAPPGAQLESEMKISRRHSQSRITGKDNPFASPCTGQAHEFADVVVNPKTAKEVRQLNQQELTRNIFDRGQLELQRQSSEHSASSQEEATGSEPQSPFEKAGSAYSEAAQTKPMGSIIAALLLRICGVLPWSQRFAWFSYFYFWGLVLLMLLAIASCVHQVFDQACSHSRTSLGRLSDTALVLGALFVLISCRAFQKQLHECNALLFSFAEQRGFLRHWAEKSRSDAMVSFLVWICIGLERIRSGILMPEHNCRERTFPEILAILSMIGFMFASGLLLMLVHHALYIARCLSCMIDTFCCSFVSRPDLAEAVAEWNVLQAVIRKSCETIQQCLLALQTTTTVAALLNVVDISRQVKEGYEFEYILNSLPGVFIVLIVSRMFFCAGAVTDKCARVPSLVNSLSFNKGEIEMEAHLDRDRLYVVEYIAHSQAGFYIFDARLTSATVLKTCYFSCVVAFALATRVASEC